MRGRRFLLLRGEEQSLKFDGARHSRVVLSAALRPPLARHTLARAPTRFGRRYGIYALLNALNTMWTLILIVPPIFFGIKTLACGYCAFYAFQLRDKIAGAEPIP